MADEKFYPVDFLFNYRCRTTGHGFAASSPEEAIEKAKRCVDSDGYFDQKIYEELGGDTRQQGWENAYEVEDSYEFAEDDFDPKAAEELA